MITMKRIAACFAAAASLAYASGASAAVGCQGVVNKVMIQPEGTVFVDFGYNRLLICNLNGSISVNRGASQGGSTTVSPITCQALLSSFLTAKASARPVIAYVDRSDCNFVDGSVPDPYPYFFYFLE